MFEKFTNWRGSRKIFLSNLAEIENNDNSFLMISNKTGKAVLVNSRRIQQFLDNGILPRGEMEVEIIFNYEHIIRYLSAIILKNQGHSLNQIEKILSSDFEELIVVFLKSKKGTLKDKFSKADTSEKLKKLGRIEGRVLRSQWVKFAVTKWCHLDIKMKELLKLSKAEVVILSEVISDTLYNFSKKDLNNLIN